MRTTRSSTSDRRLYLVAAGLVLAVSLALLPSQLADLVRTPAIAVMVPLQRGLARLRQVGHLTVLRTQAQFADAESAARRELENRHLKQENHRLRAELQAVHNQLRLVEGGESGDPGLLAAQCVPVRVLGRPAQSYLARYGLLDAGRSHGVETEALVIDTPVIIDRGVDSGIEHGAPVLAGCRVWGKIASAQSCTSTVRPITEPGYRDLVRLATPSADGHTLRYGAKGILEGTGDTRARLRMIETTEPVAEGDLVYSMAGQGFVETPLFCGQVVRVQRPQGAGHWEIWVAPAVEDTPEDPAVLCPIVRSEQMARGGPAPATPARLE